MGPAVAAIFVAGTSEIREAKNGNPSPKPIIAGFLLGAVLYALSAFNSQLGTAAAILVVSSAALINGSVIFSLTNSALT